MSTAVHSAQELRELVWQWRQDFPLLQRTVYGKPIVYLDNAATTQKPTAVVAALQHYYTECTSNVHRGVYYLSEQATQLYEEARRTVQRFLGAAEAAEIVFVRGTTEAINLVAHCLGRTRIRPGSEILLTHMEHHSNIVPWQLVAEQTGARLRVLPITPDGELMLEAYPELLTERTAVVAVVHVSNSLGTINPVAELIQTAHERGIPVLVDGAQAVAHMPVDVQQLDCDFYAFSGHKIYGPTGIGVLYAKRRWLEEFPPYQGGGDMIRHVTFERTLYNDVPYKFEAGTPNIAGAIGLKAALEYVQQCGLERIAAHEHELLRYATERLQELPGVRLIGTAQRKAAIISFVIEGVHPHDVGTVLDREGIAIRVGHHCTQPVMEFFGVPATSRVSFGLYNTLEEVDRLVEALWKVIRLFGVGGNG
ncbi:MAG: cysteine desulfurase [Chlorobiota bacterium]|jgi:cysteine desulfurase/selenocysteine lyase|nr:cysteine desulfurase [Chlorobiota bacterium]